VCGAIYFAVLLIACCLLHAVLPEIYKSESGAEIRRRRRMVAVVGRNGEVITAAESSREKRDKTVPEGSVVGFRSVGVAGVTCLISACFSYNAAKSALQLFPHFRRRRRCPVVVVFLPAACGRSDRRLAAARCPVDLGGVSGEAAKYRQIDKRNRTAHQQILC